MGGEKVPRKDESGRANPAPSQSTASSLQWGDLRDNAGAEHCPPVQLGEGSPRRVPTALPSYEGARDQASWQKTQEHTACVEVNTGAWEQCHITGQRTSHDLGPVSTVGPRNRALKGGTGHRASSSPSGQGAFPNI